MATEGVKRAIESGLGCRTPALSIHPTVYRLSSTIKPPGDGAASPLRGPGPIQDPYGCLIEHNTPLIELTALSLGPFPLMLRRGLLQTRMGPRTSHTGQSSERGDWGREKGVGG